MHCRCLWRYFWSKQAGIHLKSNKYIFIIYKNNKKYGPGTFEVRNTTSHCKDIQIKNTIVSTQNESLLYVFKMLASGIEAQTTTGSLVHIFVLIKWKGLGFNVLPNTNASTSLKKASDWTWTVVTFPTGLFLVLIYSGLGLGFGLLRHWLQY